MSLAVFSLWQLRRFHYGSWAVSAMALEDFQGVKKPSFAIRPQVCTAIWNWPLATLLHWQHFHRSAALRRKKRADEDEAGTAVGAGGVEGERGGVDAARHRPHC